MGTQVIGVNMSAEQALTLGDVGLPIFAVPHDDIREGPAARMRPFAGLPVHGVRGMSPRSDIYKEVADGLYYTYANETDQSREWRLAYAAQVKTERPGIKLVCPPERPTERYLYDLNEVALCDYVGIHIAVPEFLDENGNLKPDKTIVDYPILFGGKPTLALEIEADPAYPEQMAMIPEVARRLAAAGMLFSASWGDHPQYPNVLDDPALLDELRDLNARDIPIDRGPLAENPNPAPLPSDAKSQAERAYNLITGGLPFAPGRRYVQANADGASYTVVVTFPL